MREIIDGRIEKRDGVFYSHCQCGSLLHFTTKGNAMKMLERGSCRYCKRDYRNTTKEELPIWRNKNKKWCKSCSGCGNVQEYTRKAHAKQSVLGDWQCKPCVAKAKGYSNNRSVSNLTRIFRRFRKTARDRHISWELTEEYLSSIFKHSCALTGFPISMDYSEHTASIDRIDSNKGYIEGNVQWVHVDVNMMKNKYSQDRFVEVCAAVARHTS